jgi:hypothetical protein
VKKQGAGRNACAFMTLASAIASTPLIGSNPDAPVSLKFA